MMKITITSHWNDYLNFFKQEDRDIYFDEAYVYLYESLTEHPKCIVVEEGENIMLMPYLEREHSFNGKSYKDFETAYGYGGPICNCDDTEFYSRALKSIYKTFSENGFVAGFVRFHPLLENYKGFEEIGSVIFDRKTIAIDLTMSEDDIWMKEIHTKNRNVIKKAEKNGLTFVVDNDFSYLRQFVDLYNSTMDKLSASSFYYFDAQYYTKLKENIKNSFIGLVLKDDEILSAAIFLCSPPYAHYHLSGSNKSFLNLAPNNYMLYKAALELKQRGAQLFHLGGGTTSNENDPLYCFKSRFSRAQYQFALGKLIFNDTIYNQLCEVWEKNNPEKVETYKHFLLKYKY